MPVDDRAWLLAALADALAGGAPILPLGLGVDAAEIELLLAAPLPEGTAVVVRTSGSSGVPKAVALSAASLRASAEATHEAFGGAGQWLVTLPGHLISGLQMLVRGIVAGIEPVFCDTSGDGSFDASTGSAQERLLERAEAMPHPRRYLSLVPVQFGRLLGLAEADPVAAEVLRGFAAVLVGGQAIPMPMRRRAHELGVALRRSYGMTETSGGCVYDGVPIGDTRVRIRDGEVQLTGAALALGYVGDPGLTASRFVADPGADRGADPGTRWYRTGDAGELLGGALQVTGRLDRVIVSGGVNVSLDEVERVAREQPGWSSAVAIGVPHPEWGERVGLVVETEPGAAGFEGVRAAIRDRLGAAAAPDWATETDALPRLPGGKPDLPAVERWMAELRRSFRQAGAER